MEASAWRSAMTRAVLRVVSQAPCGLEESPNGSMLIARKVIGHAHHAAL